MSIEDIITVFMYVDPATQEVDKVACFTPFGMTQRVGSDWEPTTRAESGIDELVDHKVYTLDWSTDFLPMDAEDDGSEHAAIELFDTGVLTEDDCKKYGKLHIDPSREGSNPDVLAAIEEYNRGLD